MSRGRAVSRAVDDVTSLVAAVKEHIKFKQLAVYSIDTFCKVLAPPNPRWREFIDAAIDIDAASTVVDVIKRHPGHEAVLMACTRCLSRLAVDAANATVIGEKGGVDAVLESMAANDELDAEVLLNSLNMIDKMCNHPKSLEKIVTPGMIANVAKVMEQNASETAIVSLCAKILEKMTRAKAGQEAVQEAEGATHALSTAALHALATVSAEQRTGADDAAAVCDVAKVLTKLVGMEGLGVAAHLKGQGALNTLLGVLSVFPNDDTMAKVVSKLLVNLMDGGIAELIEQIRGGNLPPDQVERLLQLLSALAMDGDFADEIAKSGGIMAVIQAFEGNISEKAMEEIVRMIGRLAMSSTNLDEILSSGTIEKLIFCLRQPTTNADLKAQILGALNKISRQACTTSHVARVEGAVSTICQATCAGAPESEKVAREGCAFLEALAKESDGEEAKAAGLHEGAGLDEALQAVVGAMSAQPEDVATQLAGTRALANLAVSAAAVERVVAFGVVPLACTNMQTHKDEADIIKGSMELLATVVRVSPTSGADAVRQANGLDAVVGAICAHPDDDTVKQAASALVAALSNDELVRAKVEELRTFGAAIAEGTCDPDVLDKVPLAAMTLGVLALVPENVPRLAAADAAAPMVQMLDAVVDMTTLPGHAELLGTFCSALVELEAGADAFPVDDALCASLAVLGKHASKLAAVAPALKLVRALCDRDAASAIEKGAVEAVSKAMSYHAAGEDLTGSGAPDAFAQVLEPAAGAMYALCKTTETATKVGGKNGSKPCVAALRGFASRCADDESLKNDAGCCAGAVDCLRMIECVGKADAKVAARMASGGALDAVFDAMDAKAGDAAFVGQCEKAMSVLTTTEAALAILERIKGADLAAVSSGQADAMKNVTGDVNKLGLLLMCGDFAAPIQAARGGEAVAALLSAAVKAPDTKSKANLVRGCITALGRAAGRGLRIEGALELVPTLVKELKDNPGADVVNAVAALVSDAEVCEALVAHGCVAALMPLMDDPHLREPVFACLAAFAQASAAGAAEIVQNGALPFICAYLSEDMAAARAAGNMDEAIGLVAALAPQADSATLQSAGTLKVVNEILDSLADAPGKEEVVALCGLMKTLAMVHASLLPDLIAGGARKLVGLTNALCMSSDDVALPGLMHVTDLLEALCADDAAAAKFGEAGAASALIAAMNRFPNDVALATKCAAVLSRVSGGGSGLDAILARADELAAAAAAGDAATLGDLAATMRLLGNLVLQPGLVDQPAADRIMASITGALDVLYALPATPEQQDAINATLALLSRLMAIEGVEIPAESALNCLQGAFGEGMSDTLKACACAALTSLSRRGPAAVRAIASRGLIAHVVSAADRAGRARAGEGGLAGEAASALSELLTQALQHAAELAQDPDGAAALAQLLGGIHDPGKLEDALKTVLGVEGGAQALLEALTFMEYAAQFQGYEAAAAAVADALAKHRETYLAGQTVVAEAVPWKVEHVSALCAARRDLGRVDCLPVCGAALGAVDGAKLCFAGYEPEFLRFLNEDLSAALGEDEALPPAARALASVDMVAKAVAFGDADTNAGLIGYEMPKNVVTCLKAKDRRADELFVQNALYALNGLADVAGAEAMGLTKESVRVVTDTYRAHPDSAYVQETGKALAEKLALAFCGGVEAQLEEKLAGLAAIHAAAADWACVAAEDGSKYYYNARTQESAWDQPPEHAAFLAELDDLCALVDQLDGDCSGVDPAKCSALVAALTTHARDAGVCARLTKILNAVGRDAGQLDHLADVDGLENLVYGLEGAGEEELLAATELLAGVAQLDKMKAKLSTREYVRVLNQTCLDHMGNGLLVTRCATILGHLAFNNGEVIGFEMEVNVPYTLKWALQQHLRDAKLVEIAVFTASSLLTENEEQKAYVCTQLTPEFVEALKLYMSEASFFTKTMRCMGNMSIVDSCILTMSEAGTVPLVVSGMDIHATDAKLLRTAVELFSNFGATEDDEMDAACTTFLIEGGAIEAIRRILDAHDASGEEESALLTACFDALYNIGNDERAARCITEQGLCEKTLDSIRQYDYKLGLLRQCVKLVSVLTYNEFSIERLTSIGTVVALLDALQAHKTDEEFVVDSMLSLSNLVTVQANQDAFRDRTRLKTSFELLALYDDNADVVKFVLITLVRLAANDDMSKMIAEDGMAQVMHATEAFVADAEVLKLIFELLGQLAFVGANNRALVSAGGIKVLLNTLETFDHDPDLIVKTITTLDNLVSAELEYASIILERDGEGLLKRCIEKWAHEEKVVQTGQTALLSIQAMLAQKEKGRTNRAALFARLGEDMDASKLKTQKLKVRDVEAEPEEDPLKKYRLVLKEGILFKEWKEGKAVARKIMVNHDFTAVITRGPKATDAIDTRLQLSKMRRCELGNGAGHMKSKMMSSKKVPGCKPELAFVIKGVSGNDVLCGETKTKEEATAWKDAVEQMLKCATLWPHRLVSG